jgi:hypothetical protein
MRTATLIFIALLAVTAQAATRTPSSCHEDFTTTRFRDAAQTTAVWDTLTASLHLAPPPDVLVGTWNSPGSALGVEVDGAFAYLADGTAGVQILDLGEPDSPVPLGAYNTTGTAWSVDAEGDWIYVADGASGLTAINVASPAHPTVGGTYNSPGTAYAVDVAGDRAYLADGTGGLRVVSVTNPASLTSASGLVLAGPAYDVDVEGDVAWVAAYDAGLVAVNITTPLVPALLGTLDTAGTAYGVAVDGDLAYVADGSAGLVIVDVKVPTAPVTLATLALDDVARGVACDGDWVYVADTRGGVFTIDASDPANPVAVHVQNPPASARAVVAAGAHAYVADFSDGLRVLHIADDVVPMGAGATVTVDHTADDFEIGGNYLYAAAAYDGVSVYDISHPLAPVLVGACDLDYTVGLDLAGNHLYVADHADGVKVIDVTDPLHPVQVGSFPTTSTCFDVTVAGDFLLVANYAAGLTILNITDPTAPSLAAQLPLNDLAWEVAVAGNFAYVADFGAGLTVVDITDPLLPAIIANLDPGSNFQGLAATGDYVLAGRSGADLAVIDVHVPSAPALVATCPGTGGGRKVVVQGQRAYLARGSSGLTVIDLANPLAPTVVDHWDPASSVHGLAIAGDVAFAGLSFPDGLQSLRPRARTNGGLGNLGRSLVVTTHDEPLLKYRLATAQTGDIAWQVNAGTGGATWETAVADGAWHALTTPGDQPRWQATLAQTSSPACTGVDLSWLSAAPVVVSVTDIPGDQGGRVRVGFARSAFDFVGEATPITGYNLWRRVDDIAIKGEVAAAPSARRDEAAFGDLALREVAGRRYADKSLALPPGTWENVASFWAAQRDEYLVPAGTLADSSATVPWGVFCVTAHTAVPSVWYASPPDSGYSVDNLAPTVPAQLALAAGTLTWDPAPEADFAYSTVYGSSQPYLDDTAVRLGCTVAPSFVVTAQPYRHYLVTASDVAGNESVAATLLAATGVAEAPPARTTLLGAAPNPFNPATSVRYDLARAEIVTLRVYDAAGRLVRTLVDRVSQPAGRHEARWDGRTASGGAASAGVYCCRLTAGDFSGTSRLTLVK